ncbi:hypothetical protein OGAPHI_006020 [Ogataea philodendri]|uniref:DUF985 domain-containing protein n=1 Tax=Ogataea philodendri TaxID=1378263 RepID=A0A9P8NZ25_9ASCO|nr:uncharacterized protein OGAPHI_006020 [Ogataea philodendri]KAH3661842.1 hypothetical protein OGAPHI_006020 [Ogataea philodendri]
MYASATIDSIAGSAPIRKPQYEQRQLNTPSEDLQQLIKSLGLLKHQEGGYFNETDRSSLFMESPYYPGHNDGSKTKPLRLGGSEEPDLPNPEDNTKKIAPLRNTSTLIHYLLTCDAFMGRFHRNNSRIIHILQKGRGQYVLVYPDGTVKSFIVGFDVARGEVTQWVVPGGVYKASFLLPLDGEESEKDHLLISEVVVPGFEYDDHRFMESYDELHALVGDRADSLKWLLEAK